MASVEARKIFRQRRGAMVADAPKPPGRRCAPDLHKVLCFSRLFCGLVLFCLCSLDADLSLASDKPPASESEAAVKEAFGRFRVALAEGSYESLLPTLTLRDRLAIEERLSRTLPLFRVEELHTLVAEAPRRSKGRSPGEDLQPEISVTLSDKDRARADIAPLLSFRPSIYLAKERGHWKVDLTRTLLAMRDPRPKEEIISICRRALQGIADGADLLETEHFLIFAHTGPVPAQTTAELLEELYRDFQKPFPFDLARFQSPESAKSDALGPDRAGSRVRAIAAPGSSGPQAPVPAIRGPDPYMIVFLFSYKNTYRQFAARHAPDANSLRGYATPAGYFVIRFHPSYRSVARHEGAHLLMYRRMHLFAAPNWLSEGIAETIRDHRDATLRETKLRRMLREQKRLSLKPMMLKERISFRTDYQLAHSLVHFLRHQHEEEWVELIRFIRQLPPRPQAKECHAELLRLLGMTQAELDEEWRSFVLESKPAGDEEPSANR